MKKQRSIVTQTVMRVSGVFITAIILLTIVFTIFIGRYMRDNILRSKEEQLVTVADTLDSRLNSLEEPLLRWRATHLRSDCCGAIISCTPPSGCRPYAVLTHF
ncbi:hypothetical protein DW841_28040 [Hungatella hathewayi]|nr:hypothetical protein DW841_28040 [Hungatella hathewayi]